MSKQTVKSYSGSLVIDHNVSFEEYISNNLYSPCREYKLEEDITFPSDPNFTINIKIKYKINRKIQLSFIRRHQNKWSGTLNFLDLGYIEPKKGILNNIFSSKKPSVITYKFESIPKELCGSKCLLVIRDVTIITDKHDIFMDCPFDEISWLVEIIGDH